MGDALRPPPVDDGLRTRLQDHRPIVRELSVRPLVALARRGSKEAVELLHELHRDEGQLPLLRIWVLEDLRQLAEPGELWLARNIKIKEGPRRSKKDNVTNKAEEILNYFAKIPIQKDSIAKTVQCGDCARSPQLKRPMDPTHA